jgi:hypothetical protein
VTADLVIRRVGIVHLDSSRMGRDGLVHT